MPELSICILTRNNFQTCKTTISEIVKTEVLGFELLVIDASENPNALKMYVDHLDDERVRHVHVVAKDRREHWNQAIAECKGDWLTFISDADYIDPEIIQVIRRVQAESFTVESIGWNKINYDWPEHRNEIQAAKISLESAVFTVNSKKMQERFFGFEKEGLIPFTIYHGIVKRELVERIAKKFGGIYFEHQITAYELGYKVLLEAKELAFTARPFSVLSTYSEDMFSEASQAEDIEYKKGLFYQDIEVEDDLSKFPFASNWSPRILGAVALLWLVDKYGDIFCAENWEQNFVKRREDECNGLYSKSQYLKLSVLYKEAIAQWHGGKFSNQFAPKFNEAFLAQKDMVGCFNGYLFIDKNAHRCTNSGEFYTAYNNFAPPVDSLGLKFAERKEKSPK